jgi:hypothetical protein
MKTEMLSGRLRKPNRVPLAGVQSRYEALMYIEDGAAMACALLTNVHGAGIGSTPPSRRRPRQRSERCCKGRYTDAVTSG